MLPEYLIELVKKYEGLRLTSYKDSTGVLTIGWGHTGKDVHQKQTITIEEAEQMLNQDLLLFWNAIGAKSTRDLLEYEQAALTSFAFNVGFGGKNIKDGLFFLKSGKPSTLWTHAMNNDEDTYEDFLDWVYAGGKKLNGLVKRRKSESQMYLGNIEGE